MRSTILSGPLRVFRLSLLKLIESYPEVCRGPLKIVERTERL